MFKTFLIVSPPHTTLSCWDIIRTPIRLPCLVSTRIKRLAGSAISRQIICDIYDLAVRFLDCVPHCTLLLLLLALALALVFMMLLALVLGIGAGDCAGTDAGAGAGACVSYVFPFFLEELSV